MTEAPAVIVELPGYPFNNFPSLPNIAALRAVNPIGLVAGENYLVDGTSTLGDGGGGTYAWNATSAATDNGTTVIKPNALTSGQAGRWIQTGVSGLASKAELSSPTGASLVGFSQPGTESDVRDARTKIAERISLRDFGAIEGNQTANRSAFLKAQTRITVAGGELVVPAGTWDIGDTLLSMNGITIIAETGATILGNWDRKASYKLKGVLLTQLRDVSNNYLPYLESDKFQRDIPQKEVFLNGIAADRTQHIAFDCTVLQVFQVDWPGGDIWTNPTETEVPTTRTLPLTLTATVWRAGLTLAAGGDELSVVTSTGGYDRAAIIRTTGGYYYFFTDGQTGSGHLWFKPLGSAATLISNFDWSGRTDHNYWQPGFATWTIRLYDFKTFSILLNGREIVPPINVPSDVITYYGFGGKAAAATVGTFSDWTLARGKEVAGRGYMQLAVFGDSRTAPYHGAWPSYCAELLEHSAGLSVLKLYNGAVDGWTTATMLTTINGADAAGLLVGITHVVLSIGVNDAQAGLPLTGAGGTIANILAAIDLLQDPSHNISVQIVLPQDFYPKALTNNTGVVVFNEQAVPGVRQAIHRAAASRGCHVVDLSQVLKPVLAYEAKAPVGFPEWTGTQKTGLRDNIHNSELQYKVVGWEVARAIMATWPEKKNYFEVMTLPTHIIATDNGWSAASDAPVWALDAQGGLGFGGSLNIGTRTDGTPIMRFPPNLCPRGPRRRIAYGNLGTVGYVEQQAFGDTKLYGFGSSSDTTLFIDNLFWVAR